jgi:hypothetical protein
VFFACAACAGLVELDVYTLDGPEAGSTADASTDGSAPGTDALSADAPDDVLAPDDAGPDPWDAIVPVSDASCPDAFGTDPSNCGACGRSCSFSGTCAAGVCSATAVRTGLVVAPTEIAVNGMYLYFLDENKDRVYRINKDGTGQTSTPFTAVNAGYARLAADDANLVVSHSADNAISIARVGGQKLNDTQAAGFPLGVALDATRAYWANANDGRIQATFLSNPGAAVDLVPSGSTKPSLVAVSGQHLYWSGANLVAGKGLPPNNFTYSKTISGTPLDLQGYSSRVCWLLAGSIECEATPTPLTVIQNQSGLKRLAVDGSGFYFTAAGSVLACPISGCNGQPPRVIANGQNDPVGIAVDATAVYWADRGAKQILRAPK